MKILYGVAGVGMGHSTRSRVIISHLLEQGHEVRIVSSGKVFQILNDAFPGTNYEIKGYTLISEDGKVSRIKTTAETIKNVPEAVQKNLPYVRTIEEEFTPHLIISDFETFTPFYAGFFNLPVISIDNIQVIPRAELEIPIPDREINNYQITKSLIRSKLLKCDHYIITTFFDITPRKPKTEIVGPILRQDILDCTPEKGDHTLVYQNWMKKERIIEFYRMFPRETFIVYGFDSNETVDNIHFRSFNQDQFIKDLSSCKAVLANGGYSLISEAVYLGKPVCSIPMKKQFEQYLNAAYIQKLGYGRHFDDLTLDGVKSFYYDLDLFEKNLKGFEFGGHGELFEKLEAAMLRLAPNHREVRLPRKKLLQSIFHAIEPG